MIIALNAFEIIGHLRYSCTILSNPKSKFPISSLSLDLIDHVHVLLKDGITCLNDPSILN